MTEWSNKSRQFKVKIYYTPKGRAQITLPAPLINGFDKPDTTTFKLQDGVVVVTFERSKPDLSTFSS